MDLDEHIMRYCILSTLFIADILAQAACISLQSRTGWMYAIRRDCGGSITCEALCKSSVSKSDSQVLIPKIKILIAMYNVSSNRVMYCTIEQCLHRINFSSVTKSRTHNFIPFRVSKVWG